METYGEDMYIHNIQYSIPQLSHYLQHITLNYLNFMSTQSMHIKCSVPARCGLELEQTVDSPPLDLSQHPRKPCDYLTLRTFPQILHMYMYMYMYVYIYM